MRTALRAFALLFVLGLTIAPAYAAAAYPVQTQEEEQEEQETQNIEEVVVVTASRTEQLLLNSPVATSVIDSADIALSPAKNYADLMRGVPGLNITQTSARDINMSSRAASTTLDASQLVLIDGRSVYLDFFGFVAWALLPLDFSDIQQIEVVRGPGSAVWGANAMSGVVNIITKTPRAYGNGFRARAGGGERGTGFASATWTGVRPNTAWKLSAGYSTQDAWDRPPPLPNGTPGDSFANFGTSQPKADGRIDFITGAESTVSLAAGYAGTSGTIHTGIGPFQIEDGTRFWYTRADYNWRNLNVRAFLNAIDGQGTNQLNGLLFKFDSNTYDISATNTSAIGDRHSITYGANFRNIDFDLSIAPNDDNRKEGGGFAQVALDVSDHFAIDAGVRADSFSNIDSTVVSPRGAILFRPTGSPNHVLRAGFGRAFRTPSLINNFIEVTIFNQVQLPFIGPYVFPSVVVGNPELVEERTDQLELGYRGSVDNGRFTWDVAVYRSETKDSLDFYTAGAYTFFNPPPGLPPLAQCFLPGAPVPPCPPGFPGQLLLPSRFSYRNIGKTVNKGFELGLRTQPIARNTLTVNYSYQDDPEVEGVPEDEIGRPPNHRFSVGWNGYQQQWFYSAAVNYTGEAYWTDVLDSRFWGTTDAFTTVDASLGLMFADGAAEASIRATNLLNEDALQHIFGDIIGRRIVAEIALTVQ
ncbi:MAG: TonB-dependent receptor [Acidobacteria bacterium]|nr:TonB-dependent receptor [Acidobacteriota bacterium]